MYQYLALPVNKKPRSAPRALRTVSGDLLPRRVVKVDAVGKVDVLAVQAANLGDAVQRNAHGHLDH